MKNKGFIAGAIVFLFIIIIFVSTDKTVVNQREVQDASIQGTSIDTASTSSSSSSKLQALSTEIVKEGTGDRVVKTGDQIQVHYVGTLADGTKFDSSRDRGTPFDFTVGQGVIDGWSEGVLGMKLGEIIKLSIPSSLGYGSQAAGSIPANSDLYFEIELLAFDN